jgi:ribosomal protein S27AE
MSMYTTALSLLEQVRRLRKSCRECGVGVRMARHYDRFYCGKCGLTYEEAKADA